MIIFRATSIVFCVCVFCMTLTSIMGSLLTAHLQLEFFSDVPFSLRVNYTYFFAWVDTAKQMGKIYFPGFSITIPQ